MNYFFREGGAGEWVGVIGGSRYVTWFTMGLAANDAPGLEIEYRCQVSIKGAVSNTAWLKGYQPCGIATNTGNVAINGFAVRLNGPNAAGYTVSYYCPGNYVSNVPPVKSNGEFCASPDRKGPFNLTIKGTLDYMQVRVVKK